MFCCALTPGADHAGDPATHPGSGCFPGWAICIDAGGGPAATHCRNPVGDETEPENGPATGSRCSRDLRGMSEQIGNTAK